MVMIIIIYDTQMNFFCQLVYKIRQSLFKRVKYKKEESDDSGEIIVKLVSFEVI